MLSPAGRGRCRVFVRCISPRWSKAQPAHCSVVYPCTLGSQRRDFQVGFTVQCAGRSPNVGSEQSVAPSEGGFVPSPLRGRNRGHRAHWPECCRLSERHLRGGDIWDLGYVFLGTSCPCSTNETPDPHWIHWLRFRSSPAPCTGLTRCIIVMVTKSPEWPSMWVFLHPDPFTQGLGTGWLQNWHQQDSDTCHSTQGISQQLLWVPTA